MGRINVELSEELEKKLRFKMIERFGGKKGDLSKAIDEAVRRWVAEGKGVEQSAPEKPAQ